MLNSRLHAEHLSVAIDRMREDGARITSVERGYWSDLLEYRDDQSGRCDPGRRELMRKTGCGHRTLSKLDAHAEELGLYCRERFEDEGGCRRLRYVWNASFLDFDNQGQPTRVRAPEPRSPTQDSPCSDEHEEQPSSRDKDREEEEPRDKKKQPALRDHLNTPSLPLLPHPELDADERDLSQPRRPRLSHPGLKKVAGPELSPADREERASELLAEIGKLDQQRQSSAGGGIMQLYELDTRRDELMAELCRLQGLEPPRRLDNDF